jgi:Fur family transcriptional regulator, ferric uptake regulator
MAAHQHSRDVPLPKPPTRDEIHELVDLRLRQSELRYTSGRRAIVDLLFSRGQPASIADIEKLSPEVPRSSAYRHLMDLQNVGVVRRVAARDDFSRYELAENLTEHHHHLICTKCGAVTDVTASPHFESEVAEVVADIAKQHRFQVLAHELGILGHCVHCS